jgi:hypothetical protein
MKKTREMKGNLSNTKGLREAGDMVVSQPGPTPAGPNFIELIAREVEKLHDGGRISPLIYTRSRDLLPILRTSILNIYGGRVNGLQQAVTFLLKQAGRGIR